MTEPSIVDLADGALKSAVLGVPRLLVCMAILPLFPANIFPRLFRVGIAIGLGAPVCLGVFYQLEQHPLEPFTQSVGLLVLKECMLGLLLGLVLAAPFWAIEAVGTLTDNQRGANAAQQVTPFAQANASVLGSALLQAMVVLLATTGTFVTLYQFLLLTFEAWPVLQPLPDLTPFFAQHAIHRFGEFLLKAVLYAGPLLAIVLLMDFVFALMSVFAPQLQTYFAAFPVKSLAAIMVLALYAMVLLTHGERYLIRLIEQESRLLQDIVQRRSPG